MFFLNPKYFFIIILVAYLVLNLYKSYDSGLGALSSDVWMNNYIMIQEKENHPWSYMPPAYSQQDLYIAYPLLYYLSPGLSKGIMGYHVLGAVLIILTYLISGLVIQKIFHNWWLATLGALLCVLPRYILPTSIGLLGLGNVRGNAFVYPLYLLLSYYWIIYGIKDKRKNIWLAVVAGLSVYLYPPVGLIIVGLFILTSLLVRGRKYFKDIVIFSIVYLLVALPFLINHFANPNTSMLSLSGDLTDQDLALQNQILHYRFQANAFLSSLDLARIKRGAWDGFILAIIFLFSIIFYKKYWSKIREKYKLLFKISVVFFSLMTIFVFGVELINYIVSLGGKPPVFIEHLRLMRVVGFILIMHFVFVIYLLYYKFNKKWLALTLSMIIIITPLQFFAPVIRPVVRAIVPESIRLKYNLAPVVAAADVRSFANIEDTAQWVKANVPAEGTKFFVFDDFQNEFMFKVLSRQDTNLTAKEGNIYTTADFVDSKKWYEERMLYKEVTESATDFASIIDLAKELDCTHILLPRGKFMDLYDAATLDNLEVLYSNNDYKIIKIN